jgi:hypothetical protein
VHKIDRERDGEIRGWDFKGIIIIIRERPFEGGRAKE